MSWPKHLSIAFWMQTVPATFFGLLTIVLLATGVIPTYYLIATAIMWPLVCGLGIAVGYHRVFSHKTHKLPAWKENVLLFLGALAAQGGPVFWVAMHRGYHHPYADTERDLHSPVAHSKFYAFMGWIYKLNENNNTVNIKYSVDLLRKPNFVWFHHHSLKVLWITPIVIALFDWRLALTACCLTALIASMQDNIVNVYGHIKGWFGYRNFETKDNSQNNPLLGYLLWGQGWHNNHHADPKSYDFGSGVSGKWWEYDPCRLFLPLLK